jgi:hypothetical protein
VPAEHARDDARDVARDGERDNERDEPTGQWVPLALAVRKLGISRAAVYRRIRAGTLDARPRGNRGLEVLVRDDRDEGRDDRDHLADGSVYVSRDAARDIELIELRLRVEQLVERAARAEGEAAATRTQLERELARGDRLEAALAEARRPWLARVLEGLRRKG